MSRRKSKPSKLRSLIGPSMSQRIKELENALRPFARFTAERTRSTDILLPTDGDVWFYVGKSARVGPGSRAHSHTDDFKYARKVLYG